MNRSEIIGKMAELYLAIYGKKEKIPTNVENYMLLSPIKGLGLIAKKREMPTNNEKIAQILSEIHVDDLDFDHPANVREKGIWQLALYHKQV